jgi:hypothetical protein
VGDRELEIRLREVLAAVTRTDPGLLQLVRFATDNESFSVEIPLTLMVNGAMVRGRLTTPREFGEYVDESLVVGLTAAAGDEELSDAQRLLLEFFEAGFMRKAVDDQLARRSAIREYVRSRPADASPFRVTELSDDDLVNDAITAFAPQPALTLVDAEVWLVSTGWEPIGLMRVSMSQIAAWWLTGGASLDEGGPDSN